LICGDAVYFGVRVTIEVNACGSGVPGAYSIDGSLKMVVALVGTIPEHDRASIDVDAVAR
jgi:hypothetical protein